MSFPELSKKISEGLAAGVSKEKIDLILRAMQDKPELRAKVLALSSEFDRLAILEAEKLAKEKATPVDKTNTKPTASNYETSKFTKTQAVSYPVQQKQSTVETSQPEKSSKRVLAPSANVKERVNAKRRSYATARYTRVADDFQLTHPEVFDNIVEDSLEEVINDANQLKLNLTNKKGGKRSQKVSKETRKNLYTKTVSEGSRESLIHNTEFGFENIFIEEVEQAFHIVPPQESELPYKIGVAQAEPIFSNPFDNTPITAKVENHWESVRPTDQVPTTYNINKPKRAPLKNTTLSEATVENHWKVVKPVDQVPTTYNINKPKRARSRYKKAERTSPVTNRRDLAQSVYTKSIYQGSSESLVHFQEGFGFDRLAGLVGAIEEDVQQATPIIKSTFRERRHPVPVGGLPPVQNIDSDPLRPAWLTDRNTFKVKQHSIYTHRVNSTNPRLGRFDQAGAAVRVKQHSTYTHAPNSTNPRLGRLGQAGAGLNTNYRPPVPTPPKPAPKKVARTSVRDATQATARVEDNWGAVRPTDQVPTTYNINKPKRDRLRYKKAERTSPVTNRRDLAQSVYTKKKTNNLEVPVVKNNIGIMPVVVNYETSKFTKTQAVNYPVQQKQTPADPLTPSGLADRNAVKIKQHSTYTYNTKPVEVLLGRFDQAGAAVRVKQHSIYTHSANSTNPRLGRVGQAGAGLNTNYRPPAPTPPVITPPPVPPKPAPKKTSGFSNIGNSARLFSFDTETTGVNPAHSRIWQMGYATTDQKGSFSLLDAHLNPHPDFDNLPKEELEEYLRKVNGEFSEKAFKEGNFNTLIDAYLNKDLQHVGDAFENTLQKLQLGDILIMQNMNFENNMLAANIGIDKIPQPFYDELQAKLATTSADKQFDRAGKELFQRAFKVQKYMREADYEFNTKFLPNRTENNFAKYVTQLNNAYDAYDDIIKAVHPNSKVPIIELMDISKIFYGNLAASGLIEKETAGLGLNVDFLTRALFGRKEVHTAASDAKDTIEIFQSLWKHIGDMRNGVVTDELRALAKKINEQQPEEINRRFISSLKSTLDDFVNKGFTKTRSGANRYYGGEISVFNNETGIAERSAPISVGVKKDFTSDLETALKDQVAKYAELYKDDIMGFNREKFVDDILANAEDLNGNHSIKQLLDSVGKVELPSDRSLLPKAVGDIINKTGLPTDALVENRGFAGGGKVALGLAGVVGLAAMMLTPAPKQKEENNDPVFYNFYDEQYLGTGFVEFKERNKRYVY